jgi:hypothetical protein
MMGSILPDSFIDYGTDVVFIAAVIAAFLYIGKRLWGFIKEAREVTDEHE